MAATNNYVTGKLEGADKLWGRRQGWKAVVGTKTARKIVPARSYARGLRLIEEEKRRDETRRDEMRKATKEKMERYYGRSVEGEKAGKEKIKAAKGPSMGLWLR